MRKVMAMLLVLVMAVAMFAGCQGSGSGGSGKTLEGDLTEIMDKIYENHGWDENKPMVESRALDLTDGDMLKYETGLDSADGVKEIVVSTPMIGSIAYAVDLVRVENPADAKSVAQAMHDGIDQRRWMCVEADDMLVSGYGDVVMLVMVSSKQADNGITAQSITDAFKAVCGGTLDFTI